MSRTTRLSVRFSLHSQLGPNRDGNRTIASLALPALPLHTNRLANSLRLFNTAQERKDRKTRVKPEAHKPHCGPNVYTACQEHGLVSCTSCRRPWEQR